MNPEKIDQFAQQLLTAVTGAATTAMIVVGDRLGLYRGLAAGPATPAELAARTGTAERYVREWLSQQAAAGFVEYRPQTQRFALSDEVAAVLADPESPVFMAGSATLAHGWFAGIDQLVTAFRTGEGIPWHMQHPAVFEGTERFFRTGYAASLTSDWIPALSGIAENLAGAMIADIGCGHGAASVLLAQAFPEAEVRGFDFHPESIGVARKRAAEAGVSDRVRFEVAGAADYPADGYTLICLLDTLHDLGDPEAALVHARRVLAPNGAVLVVEPHAEDDFAANIANPMAALSYTGSTFQCVPASLSQPGAAALGAQAGAKAVTRLAASAGFSTCRLVSQTPVNGVFELRP